MAVEVKARQSKVGVFNRGFATWAIYFDSPVKGYGRGSISSYHQQLDTQSHTST